MDCELIWVKSNISTLENKMNEDDTCRPGSILRALINLTDSKITYKLMKQLIHIMNHSQHRFIKLAFIGVSPKGKLLIKLIQKTQERMEFPFEFFQESDFGKIGLLKKVNLKRQNTSVNTAIMWANG